MKMDETEYTELYMELEKYGTYGKRSGNIYARLYDEWGWQYRNS